MGKKVGGTEKKICGYFCIILMLFFLVGPFAFFSNLRFVATYNPINDIGLKFSMNIAEKDPKYGSKQIYEFELYSTESAVSIKDMT